LIVEWLCSPKSWSRRRVAFKFKVEKSEKGAAAAETAVSTQAAKDAHGHDHP